MTRKKILTTLVLLLLSAILIVACIEIYSIYKQKPSQTGTLDESTPTPALSDVNAVIRAVSAHVVLPTNEEPALATIEDKNKLTTQFLSKSENGDKILLYQQAQRAIIYRPSIDKIIDIGPLSILPVQ